MIKAELNYNPYLMETLIKFNGQSPRVNSLVEKYQHMNLQSWVNRIPKIFYDEMNGFDFELDFTGTKLDYEDLCSAFRRIGITEESVSIVHKEYLEDRITKQNMMDDLLKWLGENTNHRFDHDSFKAENTDLYDGGYSYVYLHGRGLDSDILKDISVSVEYLDNAEELNDTDLSCTPILIHITEKTLPKLASELSYFKARQDVTEEQLFFIIGGVLDQNTVSRIIRDLGVVNPKIVETPDAPAVRKYIEVYPITAFIKEALDKLRNVAESIGSDVDQDNEKSIKVNREIHEKIDGIEASIERLKSAKNFFSEYDDPTPMTSVEEIGDDVIKKINNWRSKKTTINKPEEAYAAALDFERDVKQWLLSFAGQASNEAVDKIKGVKKDFEAEYERTQYDDFKPEISNTDIPDMKQIKPFTTDLLEMKEEMLVEAKEVLFGMLFKTHQAEEREKVQVTTYYYNKWRDHVAGLARDVIDIYRNQLLQVYKEYVETLRNAYLNYTTAAIESEELRKNEESAQLSEDEKLLQADNDWLKRFNEQRFAIERG